MKRVILVLSIFIVFTSCTSIQDSKRYNDIATNNSFSYFFPSASSIRSFSTIEEASEFINAAEIKLGKTTGKNIAKGLAAKLIGPNVKDDNVVNVAYFLTASNTTSYIDITKLTETLEKELSNAISVTAVFLVFYEDRGVSISKFYLQTNYVYRSNSQYEEFQYKGNTYKTEYPVGWGTNNAIKYLKKEIN